jgi:methionyl-tRNA formyltransferase
MDEGLDTGPVLLWRKMALRPGDDFESIRERMAPELIRMMMKGLRGLRDEAVEPMPQALAAGRQYFVMHPRILAFAAAQIGKAIAAQSNLRQIS